MPVFQSEDLKAYIDARITALSGGSGNLPVGAAAPWFTNTPPASFLILNGVNASRATYPALWSLWGTTFGAGDGSTTFGIPNWKGKTPFGVDSAQTEFDVLATAGVPKTGGTKTITSHTHTVSAHTHPLSTLGRACILIAAAAPAIIMKRSNSTAWTATHQIANPTLAGNNSASQNLGAALEGATDASTAANTAGISSTVDLPPYGTCNWIVRAA